MGDSVEITRITQVETISDSSKFGTTMEMGDMHVNFGGENGLKLQYQEVRLVI